MTITQLKKQAAFHAIKIEKLSKEYSDEYKVTDTTDKGGMWTANKDGLEELVTGLIARQVFLRTGK